MKKIFFLILLLTSINLSAQKSQRIGYIDMEYILQNIPEYIKAQNSLNDKVEKWKAKIDKHNRKIEVMKTDLANEKTILTSDLINEREEDITVEQNELRKLENSYFGPEGEMYTVRKQLIQPIQDQVYNAVQTIAQRKKYDFVFSKSSSELIMLYTNKKHDISGLVAKLINIDLKRKAKVDKIAERKKLLNKEALSDEQKAKLAKREAYKKKRLAAKEEKRKNFEEKRAVLLKEQQEKRKLLLEKRDALRKAKLEKYKQKKAQEANNKESKQ